MLNLEIKKFLRTMGIEHGTFGMAVGCSNHSPIKDLQMVFPKLIYKLHYVMYALLIFCLLIDT